ncbi:hypothetical protein ME783_09990 [Lactobacillus delbrueckii]|uniref:Phage protein n=1 Tax=Lactobacillus delbrueckii TaxID=1584 RepID=A0ABD0AEU5_9LACO|nr:hypothetical protein [Lactobacillus delbrueckii]GHN18457.1 hypothetical protein ME783_09990 [Lactobacillus delbrueckii]GHN33589.1 hypothetical protein ME791_07410 [Lactobacillus delbrueckii]
MAEMKMKALASTQKDLIEAMKNAIDELYCENKKTLVDPLTEAQLAGVIADLANAFEKTI